jgi:hypothetical protein
MPFFFATRVAPAQIAPTSRVRNLRTHCHPPRYLIIYAGDRVEIDLSRLHVGKNEMSVSALKIALQQVEVGFMNRNISIRSARLG